MKTYFIQAVNGGPVKIGRSLNPKNRLKELQTSHSDKLELLGFLEGDEESKLHDRFNKLRLRGEWFRCEVELVEYLYATGILSQNHRRKLRDLIAKPISGATPRPESTENVILGACDVLADCSDFETRSAFGAEIYRMFCLEGYGPPCDCPEHQEQESTDDDGCDDECGASMFLRWGEQLSSMPYLDCIERIGIGQEDETVYIVTKYLSSEKRQRIVREEFSEFAFLLDNWYWNLHLFVNEPGSQGAQNIDGFSLYLAEQKLSLKPTFGDPDLIRLRDWQPERQ